MNEGEDLGTGPMGEDPNPNPIPDYSISSNASHRASTRQTERELDNVAIISPPPGPLEDKMSGIISKHKRPNYRNINRKISLIEHHDEEFFREMGDTRKTQSRILKNQMSSVGDLSNTLSTQKLDNKELAGALGTEAPAAEIKKHGTFWGVILPTCENMWGVLIFLRFYFIVGHSGFLQAEAIVFLAFLNAILTSCSLSAMATSGGSVSWGGPYHMICKTLGPLLGVTIGLIYYVGNTLLAALKILGAIETIEFSTNRALNFTWSTQCYAIILSFLLVLCMLIGMKFVHKMSAAFAAIVVLTIICTIIGIIIVDSDNPHLNGWSTETLNDNLMPSYSKGHSFASMLGLFFPCYAGFMSGASRAKFLVKPKRNIPQGTFASIILSFLLYSGLMLLWAGTAHREYLKGNDKYINPKELKGRLLSGSPDGGKIIKDTAFPHEIAIEIGIIISCLSQCLQCLIVASRMLSRISRDEVIKWLRALGVMRKDEPIRALFATFFLGCPLLLTGSLDVVAPILSCCFLMTFAFINISCFTLSLLRPASWRPAGISKGRWRFLYIFLAFSGFVLNISLMLVINWYYALTTMAFAVALYIYVEVVNSKEHGGSALRGLFLHAALSALRHLKDESEYSVNWRPQLVCIMEMEKIKEQKKKSQMNEKHLRLLTVANQLRKAQGLCLADPTNLRELDEIEKLKNEMDDALEQHVVDGFSEIIVARDFLTGYSHILQISGLGGLVPNTVLLEFPDSLDVIDVSGTKTEQLISSLRIASELGKAIIVAKTLDAFSTLGGRKMKGNIDLWWIINDGGLMLLLAHFLMQHRIWRKCKLRVFVIGDEGDEEATVEGNMRKLMEKIGVEADEVNVVRTHIQLYEPYLRSWVIRKNKRAKILKELKSQFHPASIPSQVSSLIPRSKQPTNAERLREFRKVISKDPEVIPHHHHQNESSSEEDSKEAHDVHSIISIEEESGEEGSELEEEENKISNEKTNTNNKEQAEDRTIREATHYEKYLTKVRERFYSIPNAIGEKSRQADLVILNLPEPDFKKDCHISQAEYMIYLSRITNNLDRVLLIHGSGMEIIEQF